MAHLDVVEARREDWSTDPFKLVEQDGYLYGRGTMDDKSMAAIWIAALIQLKKAGTIPGRDIIVALTADEEGGDYNGVQWLLEKHRILIDAEFALNEGGGGEVKAGKKILNSVQASEKIYQSFRLEVKNPGGHSSRPTKDNAIYRLADGLSRLSKFEFPVKLNEVTSTYFRKMADLGTGQASADMRAILRSPPDSRAVARLSQNAYDNALMRTTCVATQLEAGHAENALPQTARATVNCRILPGETARAVQVTLTRILNDPAILITPIAPAVAADASPLRPEIIQPIESITADMWPGVPVVPVMATGATDGLFLRNAGIPTYGVSGLFSDVDDNRAHGKDERVGINAFFESREFLFRLVRALSR
jgi:acetylornithine deacetylase/succinyl-diaminopimelate desuccinylase-like protein